MEAVLWCSLFFTSLSLLPSFSFSPFLPPPQVARHLAKLFDSMAKLKFEKDENDKPTKTALGMWSKDGEYVDFNQPCNLTGQVCGSVHELYGCTQYMWAYVCMDLYVHTHTCTHICTCVQCMSAPALKIEQGM